LKRKKLLFARSEPIAAVPDSGVALRAEDQQSREPSTPNAKTPESNFSEENIPPNAEQVNGEAQACCSSAIKSAHNSSGEISLFILMNIF
jgi:hypothetical protein